MRKRLLSRSEVCFRSNRLESVLAPPVSSAVSACDSALANFCTPNSAIYSAAPPAGRRQGKPHRSSSLAAESRHSTAWSTDSTGGFVHSTYTKQTLENDPFCCRLLPAVSFVHAVRVFKRNLCYRQLNDNVNKFQNVNNLNTAD